MTLYGFLVFCLVYTAAVMSPGPGVAAVVARSLVWGTRGAPAFIAGFVVGELIWLTVAATGLAALAQSAYMVFAAVKYAGAAYLLYLAWRMWTAPAAAFGAQKVDPSQRSSRLFLGSLALTLGNPKAMVFFLALLPTVVPLETLSLTEFVELTAVILLVLPAVICAYMLAAVRARQMLQNPRAQRLVNRGGAGVMAGAAAAVVQT